MASNTTTKSGSNKASPRRQTSKAKQEPSTTAKTKAYKKAQPSVSDSVDIKIDQEVIQQMIAESAYLRAEKRGFAGGDSVEDWLNAEAEITALLAATNKTAEKNKSGKSKSQ